MDNETLFASQLDVESMRGRWQRAERSGVYLRRGQRILTSDYSVVTSSAVTDNASINTPNTSIDKLGSTAPGVATRGFAATRTSGTGAGSASLTIYWDGTNGSTRIIRERSDGSQFVVPKGSLAVSGLNPATLYYFLPFWPLYGCNVGFVLGSVGTPQVAFTVNTATRPVAEQGRQDREALTLGYMSFTTAAESTSDPGTSPGGGGDPGPPGGPILH